MQANSLVNRIIGYLGTAQADLLESGLLRPLLLHALSRAMKAPLVMGLARACAGYSPYPAHRLDMYTSGVVIVAKKKVTVVRLHEMFRQGSKDPARAGVHVSGPGRRLGLSSGTSCTASTWCLRAGRLLLAGTRPSRSTTWLW